MQLTPPSNFSLARARPPHMSFPKSRGHFTRARRRNIQVARRACPRDIRDYIVARRGTEFLRCVIHMLLALFPTLSERFPERRVRARYARLRIGRTNSPRGRECIPRRTATEVFSQGSAFPLLASFPVVRNSSFGYPPAVIRQPYRRDWPGQGAEERAEIFVIRSSF